jgi:hypothetical protein
MICARHSAILALLDVHHSESPVFTLIEQQVRALSLTESFVQLAKAEAIPVPADPVRHVSDGCF